MPNLIKKKSLRIKIVVADKDELLTAANELIKLQNGKIELSSDMQSGLSFQIMLPKK